jgi:pyridoxamine 5'-phosphate oxidase
MTKKPSKEIPPLYAEALQHFDDAFARAKRCGLQEPNAVTLATADAAAKPSARTVLLKDFDEAGFVFYTNIGSRKGRELMSNRRAALCFFWQPLQEQVHVEGPVTLVTDNEADQYWASRPRESQIGAWASLQSRPLENRAELEDRAKEMSKKYATGPVPRPPYWTGFRVVPERLEFWKMRPYRLHERTVYQKSARGWTKGLLFP